MGVCTSKRNKDEIISIESSLSKTIPPLKECEFRDYRKSIVDAYIRDIQQSLTENHTCFYIFSIIPPHVNKLIRSYYPLFQIYGIGANFAGLWESDKNLDEFTKLTDYEKIISHPNNIYHGNYCYFIKDFYNEIYGIGRNYYNELCLNYKYNYPFVDKFQKIESFQSSLDSMDYNSQIEFVSHGIYGYTSKSTAFKLRNGSIYLSDNNYICNYDNDYDLSSNKLFATFHKLSSDSFLSNDGVNIISIECGIAHLLFLSSNGRVYGMGNNNYSQLGFPFNVQHRYKKIVSPVLIEKLVENKCVITSINCGKNHNCVIDKNTNKLWCFGDNSSQQSSNKDTLIVMEPEIYDFNGDEKHILKAECGMDFTVCLDKIGNCYGFGDVITAVKGIADYANLSDNNLLFKDFSVGNKHCILISVDDKIYSFGINTCNQCGIDHDTDKISDVMLLTNDLFPGLDSIGKVRRVIAALNQTLIIYD